MTLATQLVLRAMLAEPTQETYGLQICQDAGLPSGTIHPILARLQRLGWLESCLAAQPRGLPGDRLVKLPLGRALQDPGHLGEQVGPARRPARGARPPQLFPRPR